MIIAMKTKTIIAAAHDCDRLGAPTLRLGADTDFFGGSGAA